MSIRSCALVKALVLFALICPFGHQAYATVIASSGFNDQTGLNSTPTPNSPYTIGQTVDGRGEGESGWAGNWITQLNGGLGGDANALITSDAAKEGDGGLSLIPNGQVRAMRRLAVPQTRSFSIEQDVNFGAAGTLFSRPYSAGASEPWSIGPMWSITGPVGSRHFEVNNGQGNGLDNWITTGIAQTPGAWQHVEIDLNVATQTWTFSVDGQKFNQTLGYLGTPATIDYVEYLSDAAGYIDSVVVSTPEPTAVAVIMPALVRLLVRRSRRR